MTTRPIAYLASEIPSVSATFVYREIAAFRSVGFKVAPFSIHPVARESVSPDGMPFFDETDVLYCSRLRMAKSAISTAIRHPLGTLKATITAVTDTLRGSFSQPGQRWKVLAQLFAGLALAERLDRVKTRHLHIHFAHAPANVGMYAALASSIPFSITAHANDIYVEASLLGEKLARAQTFATISEANRSFLREQFGELGRRAQIVRCGVDVNEFTPHSDSSNSSNLTVFALGRLVPKKGFDVLLWATAKLSSTMPGLRVRIAGDGPQDDALKQLAADLGISDQVEFLGALTKDQVRSELAQAAIFALPCRIDSSGDVDGIPVCLMEAMAAGVPVISTRLSGIPELIKDGETGLLVDPEAHEQLAASIKAVLSSPKLAKSLTSKARAFVEQQFDLTANALTLAALILPLSAQARDKAQGQASVLENTATGSA